MGRCHYQSLALWVCGILACCWAWIVTVKYYYFGYEGWDLPLYAQLMWNLCQGTSHNSLFGGNFLISHFNFIAYLLTPFYFFFQSELTLLYFKVIAFFVGAYIFYLVAAKKIGARLAFWLMLGYMFYPANVAMLLFEFNFESFALPLILASFYYFEQKKWWPFMVCSLILMLVKENMPPVVMMFGLLGGFIHRYVKRDLLCWGVVPLVVGGGVFMVEQGVLVPLLIKKYAFHTSIYWDRYSSLGAGPGEILKTLVFNPVKVVGLLFPKENVSFLAELFGPLVMVSLMSSHILLLGLPLFLQNLLSNYVPQHLINFYYASTLSVFVFLSSLYSFTFFLKKNQGYLVGVVIAAVLIFDAVYLPQWYQKIPWSLKKSDEIAHYILSRIPSEAGVLSSYSFLSFLSQRKDVYVVGRSQSVFTKERIKVADSVSYAAINFENMFIDGDALKELIANEQWFIDVAVDNLVLLRKDLHNKKPLMRIQTSPKNDLLRKTPVLEDSFIQLQSVRFKQLSLDSVDQQIFPVEYDWRITENSPFQYAIVVSIYQKQKLFWQKTRRICYGVPLRKGEYIQEQVNYLIPALPAGDKQILVELQALKQLES